MKCHLFKRTYMRQMVHYNALVYYGVIFQTNSYCDDRNKRFIRLLVVTRFILYFLNTGYIYMLAVDRINSIAQTPIPEFYTIFIFNLYFSVSRYIK